MGGAEAVQSALKSGKLAAFVQAKPGGSDGAAAETFDKRFLLVTAQNLDQVLVDYPRLFSAPADLPGQQ
jgi:hypothetical protein